MRRVVGFLSLIILLLLCFHSLGEAPKHWKGMAPVSYLLKNIEKYNNSNLEIYIDGSARDVKIEEGGIKTFTLGYDPFGLFGSIKVKTKEDLQENQSVCVQGQIKNYVLIADNILTKSFPRYTEIIFNLLGLFIFIHFSLKEWETKKEFPFIKLRENA